MGVGLVEKECGVRIGKIKSPLRYPGGKSRAASDIYAMIPDDVCEYREPMVGGGSVFLHTRQARPDLKFWINDLNPNVYMFWKIVQDDSEGLAREIGRLRSGSISGRDLFVEMSSNRSGLTPVETAVRFFVLNRMAFSGLAETGGYSGVERFTESSIDRVAAAGSALEGVTVTCLDYGEMVDGGEEIFSFFDPPYMNNKKSRLYGENGALHADFDHERFVRTVRQCRHSWLVTYNDSTVVRKMFEGESIIPYRLQYGMNNYMQTSAAIGREVMIVSKRRHHVQERQCNNKGPGWNSS